MKLKLDILFTIIPKKKVISFKESVYTRDGLIKKFL